MENVKETNGNSYLKCYKNKNLSPILVVGRTKMLRNISVRTCIILFMVCTFLLVDTLQIAFLHDLPILITCNIIYLISALLLWWYMTCYLVVPINTVKKSIEEVAAGNLSIHISEFG
ncbi:methyl-accepting chemotaxis protein, partial [Salmonella enterica subsp. enterica serovar Meleagridis]